MEIITREKLRIEVKRLAKLALKSKYYQRKYREARRALKYHACWCGLGSPFDCSCPKSWGY